MLYLKMRCKKTKNGSQYLDALISDKDGEMSAKLWDFNGSADTFEQDMIVKIRGTVEAYNGKDQFRISQIRPTSNEDNYSLSDLVPASEIGGEQLFNMIKKRVDAFENEDLKKSFQKSLTKEKICSSPTLPL